jgi:hypothetical protein
MSRYKVGDRVFVQGRAAKVVWFRENPNEIEAIDEYIVEFENKQRRFIMSRELHSKQGESMKDREDDSDYCQSQTYQGGDQVIEPFRP